MVTGSHNPPDYNGLKMVVAGATLSGAAIQALRQRIEEGNLATGAGTYATHDIVPAYLDRIVGDVKLTRPLQIAVDCGNGVAGAFAPSLFRRMGCTVVELFCDVDGHFPNHHPDPSQPANLADLTRRLNRATATWGLPLTAMATGWVSSRAMVTMIYPDPAIDAVPRRSSDTRAGRHHHLRRQVHAQFEAVDHAARRRAALWKTGHSLIKAKMKETHAALPAR